MEKEREEELRELIREANGTMKDLKAVIKMARETIDELTVLVHVESRRKMDECINEVVEEKIDELSKATSNAIKESEQMIFDRFDALKNVMLGEDKESIKKGEPSLMEYAELMRALRTGK